MNNSLVARIPKAITFSQNNLNLNGNRLKLIMFSKITTIDYLMNTSFSIEISALEWQEIFNSEQPYRDLRRGSKNIENAYLKFNHDDTKTFKFCDKVLYNEGSGKVVLEPSIEMLTQAVNIKTK